MARFAFLHPDTTVEMVDEILDTMRGTESSDPAPESSTRPGVEDDAQCLDVLRAGYRPGALDEEEGHPGHLELGGRRLVLPHPTPNASPPSTSSTTTAGTPAVVGHAAQDRRGRPAGVRR